MTSALLTTISLVLLGAAVILQGLAQLGTARQHKRAIQELPRVQVEAMEVQRQTLQLLARHADGVDPARPGE